MAFLSTLWNLWESGQTNLRKLVLRLAFPDRISYKRGSGFSNAKKRCHSDSWSRFQGLKQEWCARKDSNL